MGRRKKKPFINKKEAQTYRLVPRSHQDPLAGDVEESQYVLKPEIVQVKSCSWLVSHACETSSWLGIVQIIIMTLCISM